VIRHGDFGVNMLSREVTVGGIRLDLSVKEYELRHCGGVDRLKPTRGGVDFAAGDEARLNRPLGLMASTDRPGTVEPDDADRSLWSRG
jgi:hypothetical protein